MTFEEIKEVVEKAIIENFPDELKPPQNVTKNYLDEVDRYLVKTLEHLVYTRQIPRLLPKLVTKVEEVGEDGKVKMRIEVEQ